MYVEIVRPHIFNETTYKVCRECTSLPLLQSVASIHCRLARQIRSFSPVSQDILFEKSLHLRDLIGISGTRYTYERNQSYVPSLFKPWKWVSCWPSVPRKGFIYVGVCTVHTVPLLLYCVVQFMHLHLGPGLVGHGQADIDIRLTDPFDCQNQGCWYHFPFSIFLIFDPLSVLVIEIVISSMEMTYHKRKPFL